MPNRGKFIGNDNLYVPDAPTIGTATGAVGGIASIAFTAPSDVGNDDITAYGVSATDGTNVIGATGSSSPITLTGLIEGTSYTAQVWAINDYGNGPLSSASNSFSPAAARGIFAGGYSNDPHNIIDYITISTDGNATDFGDMTHSNGFFPAGTSSSTRGIFSGGFNGGSTRSNVIQYITIATTGNATDFGDTSSGHYSGHGHANTTRGIITLGNTATGGADTNIIEYITIASTGNSTDFGDISQSANYGASCASSTRGVIVVGESTNTIEYITIASTGNTTDFGNLTRITNGGAGGCSSATRGVFFINPDGSNHIQYITIASTGNATNFGDVSTNSSSGMTGAVSSRVRGVTPVGHVGSVVNNLEKITIDTAANSTDFGDLSVARYGVAGCSNDHGGLQ